MVSPLRHEEIPKDVNFMICGADLLRYPHSCRIFAVYSTFCLLWGIGTGALCLLSGVHILLESWC